jgi:hypothetical protein
MKKLFIGMMMALVAALGLTACGPAPEEVQSAIDNAKRTARSEGRTEGAADEVRLAESRYLTAKKSVEKIAVDNARKAELKHVSGCNIVPVDLVNSKSYQDLKITGDTVYKTACAHAIAAMRKQHARDVAQEKARLQKVATAKLKACDKVVSRVERNSCVAAAKRHT